MGTNRTTFLINEVGVIEDIISDVNAKDSANQILNLNK
jgi:peroxiredoxin